MSFSFCPTQTMSAPTAVAVFGPAGTPQDLRKSGANILETFCNFYLDTDRHSLLPTFFGYNITDLMEARD